MTRRDGVLAVIGFIVLTALEENEETLMVFGNDLLNAAFFTFLLYGGIGVIFYVVKLAWPGLRSEIENKEEDDKS